MTDVSIDIEARTNGGREPQDLSSRSILAMNDSRNSRLSNIINSQAPQSSSSSAFDGASPVSLDFNFPFSGSPHGSSTSGIDAPLDLRMGSGQALTGRGSMSDISRRPRPETGQQHRASLASIDSAFDHEMMNSGNMNQWTSLNSNNHAISNSDDSPRKTENDSKQEKRTADDETKPAWSELKTKAGKERKRLPLACIACRRKKIRCSGEKPACKHCLRARVPCVYKVTTRKAAPRTDYMAMLDKRLKRMEDRVIKVIPKDELPDLSTTGRASVRPPLPSAAPKKDKSAGNKKRSADEAFTQELSDWTQTRQRTALLDPATGLKKQREGENKLFIEGSESLPPQHIQEHLAEVFFDCVYGQSYLLLHKPSFMRKLKAGTVPPVLILAVCAIAARFSTHPHVNTEPAFLRGEQWATPARRIIEKRHYEPNITILIAMIMLGLHYFGTCEGGLSWSFGGQAMRMGYALQLHRELDHDPLGRNQIAGKTTLSDAARAGLKPPELSFTDREIRRRTMWACYLMDTFNSSGTERPSFLNEDYFQIQLPIKESHFQMEVPGPTEDISGSIPVSSRQKHNPIGSDPSSLAAEAKSNMGIAAYIIRAVALWKRIVKYLNLGGKEKDPHPIWDNLSEFASLARAIATLKTSLPSHLLYNANNLATHATERLANQFLTLHIILAQTSLFLHRFAIPTYPSSRPHHHHLLASGMPKLFLTSSAQIVIDSAAAISNLISSATGHTLTIPFAGYCAYASATVHVWGIFSRSPTLESTSKENLSHNYKYLNRMKRYWGMFHYMAESVKDTYRAFADASLKHPSTNLTSAAATLLRTRSTSSQTPQPQPPHTDGQATPYEISRSATPSHSATNSTSSTAGRQMFQYGDWFDKYPHGVSESEWESSHLEFRKEGDKGSEAVMSQRSDLQSVEEFFASLSPPSKAEELALGNSTGGAGGGPGGGRNKKVARRRGKSMAEASGAEKKTERNGKKAGESRHNSISIPPSSAAAASVSASANHALSAHSQPDISLPPDFTHNTSAIDLPFDLTSPGMYQTPQLGSNDPFSQTNFGQFGNFGFQVPNLDRQMVFGAYAGIDPSSISSHHSLNSNHSQQQHPNQRPPSAHSQSNQSFSQSQAFDPAGLEGLTPNFSFSDQQQGGWGAPNPSAYMMPFNIEPPNFSGGGGMDELGSSALDGMDFGFDIGGGGGGGMGVSPEGGNNQQSGGDG